MSFIELWGQLGLLNCYGGIIASLNDLRSYIWFGYKYFWEKQYQFSHGHNYNKFYLGFVGFEHGLLAVRTHT